jgi:hypothetical protein
VCWWFFLNHHLSVKNSIFPIGWLIQFFHDTCQEVLKSCQEAPECCKACDTIWLKFQICIKIICGLYIKILNSGRWLVETLETRIVILANQVILCERCYTSVELGLKGDSLVLRYIRFWLKFHPGANTCHLSCWILHSSKYSNIWLLYVETHNGRLMLMK